MPPMENTPDRVTHVGPSSDLGPGGHSDVLDTTASAAEEISPPLPIISEHEVILATAAATAASPSFEDWPSLQERPDSDADATEDAGACTKDSAVQAKSGWIATLLRRGTRSGNARPARWRYPPRLDGEFIADARMDREMYRL